MFSLLKAAIKVMYNMHIRRIHARYRHEKKVTGEMQVNQNYLSENVLW